jgi:hypothetical protein
MNLAGILVGGGLVVAVVAEGAYIVHTRSEVEALSAKIEALESGGAGSAPSDGAGTRRSAPDDDRTGGDGLAARPGPASRPVPRFVTEPQGQESAGANTNDPLPLPPALSSPESREQLRQFVLASLDQERQENRARADERREQDVKARRDRAAKDLGLSPAEAETFSKIQADSDAARAALRAKVESGQVDRGAVRQEMVSIRAKTEQQLRDVLGDERMKKYEEIRSNQGPPGGEGFTGGRFNRWGGAPQGPEGAPPPPSQ